MPSQWRSFVSPGTLVTAALSVVAWGLQFGWASGFLLVLLLFVHELGHLLAAKARGIEITGAPLFLPGLGAFVTHGAAPRVWDQVLISLGGPLLGGSMAALTKVAGQAMGNEALAFAGGAALVVNLLNLAPIPPLDGGQVASRIGWYGLIPTVVLALGLAVLPGSTFVALLVALAAVWLGYKLPDDWNRGLPVLTGLGAAAAYVGSGLLLYGLHWGTGPVHGVRSLSHPITALLQYASLFYLAVWLIARAIWPWTHRPERTARQRYLAWFFLGWPLYLTRNASAIPMVACAAAQSLGLPGVNWLRQWVWFLSARRDQMVGSGAAMGYDVLARQGREQEANDWLAEISPLVKGSGMMAISRCHGNLLALGHIPTAHSWLLPLVDEIEDPETVPAALANSFAWALLCTGRPQEGLPLARISVAKEPDKWPSLDTLGRILLHLGELEEAEVHLRTAVEKSGHVGSKVALGRTLAGLGRYKEALSLVEAALNNQGYTWPPDEPQPDEVRSWVVQWRQEAS